MRAIRGDTKECSDTLVVNNVVNWTLFLSRISWKYVKLFETRVLTSFN